MKSLLAICLVLTSIYGRSSFKSDPGIVLSQLRIIHVFVVSNTTQPVPGTPCTALIHISLTYDYNTVTGAVTNINPNTPTVTVTCPDNFSRIVYPTITTLTFDASGYVSTLAFSTTGDTEVDALLSSTKVISDCIDDLNAEIAKQM